LALIATTVPTVNVSATALRFFFQVTLKRRDLANAVVSVREPRRVPIVLSPEEVGRQLASTANIKHRAALSLIYATGLRSSEVVWLKLTDRMVRHAGSSADTGTTDERIGGWLIECRPLLEAISFLKRCKSLLRLRAYHLL
jgi:site-specific recombinase XerD